MKTYFCFGFALAGVLGVVCSSLAANSVLRDDQNQTPEQVIVAPMCEGTSWWNQDGVDGTTGKYLNGHLCGCDPLAWGQIVTYYGIKGLISKNWSIKQSSGDVYIKENNVQVKLESRKTGTLVTENNPNPAVAPWTSYAWATTNDDAGKDHAAKLMWDLNVIGHAVYESGATKATAYQKNPDNYENEAIRNDTVLTTHFSFLEGKGWMYTLPKENSGESIPQYWKDMVFALLRGSLQAGAPVKIGVTGHAMVCDGFGFQGDVPYFHLNYGWQGWYNCWVPIEWFWKGVTAIYSQPFSNCIVNVHPQDLGCIIAGIVTSEGQPVVGATVTCTGQPAITTNEKGAYVFTNLTPDTTYTVTCQEHSQTVTVGKFIDDNALSPEQTKQDNELGKDAPPVLLSHGHAIADFNLTGEGAEVTLDAELLATFKDFNRTTDGDYTLNADDITVSQDGSVTIADKPIVLTYNGNAWANTDGITVLMKYSNLPTSSDCAIAVTSRTTSFIGSSCEGDDGQGKGVDGTAIYYNNPTTDARGAVSTEGYWIFEYKYDGDGDSTFAYDGTGNVVYKSSKLKYSSGDIGKTVCLGGVTPSSLLATGLVVEGVQIFKGALPQNQIVAATKQFESYEYTATGPDPDPGETEEDDPQVVDGTKPPSNVIIPLMCLDTDWSQQSGAEMLVDGYFCGCDALAWGQVVTYHALNQNHPVADWERTSAFENTVTVNGTEKTRSTILGLYDWNAIKDKDKTSVFTAEGVSLSHVQRLFWDLGVIGNMEYKSGGSAGTAWKYGEMTPPAYFEYQSCGRDYSLIQGGSQEERRERTRVLLRASLQVGSPVVTDVLGHVMVTDGWGIDENGTEWFHIDKGYGSGNTIWRNVDALVCGNMSGTDVNTLDIIKVIALVHPTEELKSVVVGRVATANYAAVESATVTLTAEDGTVYTTTTDSRGLYAFKNLPLVDTETFVAPNALPKDKYTLRVTKPGYQAADPVEVLIGGYITDEIRTQKHNEAEALGYDDFYPYDIGCAVADVTLKESVTPAFDWTPGSAPTGWFTSWGEAGGSTKTVVSANSAPENLYVVYHDGDEENQKWHPWVNMSTKNSFTLATYGCADMVQASAGKLAVLWCMGSRGGSKILLAKDEENHIKVLQTSGTTVPTTVIDAGEVSGYHLFTVRFSTETGLSLQIDNGEVKSNATLTTVAAAGFQVGAIYEGIYSTDFERGLGFVVCKMIGYDSADCSATQYAELCATYPAVATMNALAYSTAGGALYLPSLTLASGTLRVKNGVLEVPAGVTASLKSLEFGDQNNPVPTFGMNLAGALTVTANQTFEGNGCDEAYDACNNDNGVNLGEWTGNGTYNITGSFVAEGAIVELCHDAESSALNVNGGVFKVKGVTVKSSNKATVNLTNNGTINYGQYASAPSATIAKTYGHGMVTGTASWTDTDAITLTDAANGTTFLADGITQTYTGAISGDGKAIINAPNGGKVVFKNFTASAVTVRSGLLELLLTDEQLAKKETPLDAATVEVAEGAQIILGGAASGKPLKVSVVDGKLSLTDVTTDDMVTGAMLRISEVMPKGSETNLDPNGLESGWIELVNTSSDKWVNLADYCFTRINRSKKLKENPYGNFPSHFIPPGGRFVFYTSESYPNGSGFVEDGENCGLFGMPDPDGAVPKFYDYGTKILVWPDKVNPKKFPYVRLYYAPADGDLEVVDTVVVPSDLPEDASIVVEFQETASTIRWYDPKPTPGAVNHTQIEANRLGPNVGPLYERADGKKTEVVSEFDRPTPPAKPGEDYLITVPVNAVMNPTGGITPRAEDEIKKVQLVYRKDLDDATLTTNELYLAKSDMKAWGNDYTNSIPAGYFPNAGHLIQWKVLITDGAGNEWTSPSFRNKDDGYEWYGTIVEPGELNSATLPTWHMFADAVSEEQMDRDANFDDKELGQDPSKVPYNARVAIYDSSTSNYYDYVRIDLRGNTSAGFTKKSHGLRFAKAHPLTMTDIVTGETVEEIRKSSLISEFGDPSWMRQMVAFWLFNRMGNKVPFDFPVRCNLNGKFYQLAFHSERFTDELLEDFYGLDKFGYGYKNVGTLKSGSGTSAGDIEKKTPDDGDEGDISVLENELRKYLKQYGAETNNIVEKAELTQFVVRKFDLPAWINYIASSKITHETDDVWANISAYYDNPAMRDDTTRGTGTWMPLAYDFNLSFGQWYYNDASGAHTGLMADEDWFKSHPFYGGNRVRCHNSSAENATIINNGNSAYEAIFQSEKFRRLYLRRLRTLMDQELKEPGTDEKDVPFMVKMRELADLMCDDSALDTERWKPDTSDDAIDVWRDDANSRPADIDKGINEIWEKYVVPRQIHLYQTHSVNNTEKDVGYDKALSAGIPEAQSPIAALSKRISAEYDPSLQAVVIRNYNDQEVIDLSGCRLTGPVCMTLPAGTMLDQADNNNYPGEVYVTADRRATIMALGDSITDQVVVGNGEVGDTTARIALVAADENQTAFYLDAWDNGVQLEETTETTITLDYVTTYEAATNLMNQVNVSVSANSEIKPEYLTWKCVPVMDKKGEEVVGYQATVVLNPEKVDAPVIGVKSESSGEEDAKEPIEFTEEEGQQKVTIHVKNAVPGLWYGYLVGAALNELTQDTTTPFARATTGGVNMNAIPRPKDEQGNYLPSAFFKIIVLPYNPNPVTQ